MRKIITITKEQLQYYLKKELTLIKMAEIEKCSIDTIMDRLKRYGLKSLGNATHYKGNKNPAKNKVTKDKISGSVKKLWDEDAYKNRINGMTNKVYWEHHSFTPKWCYRDYAGKYHDLTVCLDCNVVGRKIDVHHIDENKKNWLLSNLLPVCNVCHQKYHFKRYKQPFVTVGKQFKFESCHNLLRYDGDCSRKHGHSYLMDVFIKSRINPETGMVIDYKKLSNVVKSCIIEYFDHYDINEKMQANPTAENMLIFTWEKLEKEGLIKGLERITIKETASSIAEITKQDMLEFYTLHKEDVLSRNKVKRK